MAHAEAEEGNRAVIFGSGADTSCEERMRPSASDHEESHMRVANSLDMETDAVKRWRGGRVGNWLMPTWDCKPRFSAI